MLPSIATVLYFLIYMYIHKKKFVQSKKYLPIGDKYRPSVAIYYTCQLLLEALVILCFMLSIENTTVMQCIVKIQEDTLLHDSAVYKLMQYILSKVCMC